MKKIIIIFILPLLLTGCFGYNDLNNLMIINNFPLTKKNNYILTLNEITETKQDLNTKKEYKKINITCKNITKCFNKFKTLPKKVYLSHLESIFLTNNLTKKDLEELIFALNKHKELREDFYIMFIEKDTKVNNILKTYLNHNTKKITFYKLKKSYINKEKIKIPIIRKTKNTIKIINYKIINWRNYEKN